MTEKRVFEGWVAEWDDWEDHDTFLMREKFDDLLVNPPDNELSIEYEIRKFRRKRVRITIEEID